MLNVVLWLTGICLCQAISDYRPSYKNWRREALEPWQALNSSKLLKNYRKFRPRCKIWPPNAVRHYLRPPFQFGPYYPEIHQKHCFPYINSIPVSHNSGPFETSEIRKHRRMLLPTINQFPIEKIQNEFKDNNFNSKGNKDSDSADVIFNDTCLQLPQNETMIISPTILIGQKNDTLQNDEWILSNRPINIYLKKMPKNDNMFKICKHSDVYKSKLKKSNEKNDQGILQESGFMTTCSYSKKLNHTVDFHEDVCTSMFDEEKIWTTNSLTDGFNIFTEKCVSLSHPIKKKVYKSNVDNNEIIPRDKKNKNGFIPSKELICKNTSSTKHRRDVKSHLKKKHFRRFYSFPNVRRCLKRSCNDHKQFKRMTLTTDPSELEDYLSEPEYCDDYEYEIDDDLYPQDNNYQENLFLNDYSYISDFDPSSFQINSDNMSYNKSITSELPDQNKEMSSLPDIDKSEVVKQIYESDTQFSTPLSNVFVQLNNKEQYDKSFEPPLNKQEAFASEEFNQSSLIKNLTDELEKKMDLLNNLTMKNLLSVRKKMSFDSATFTTETKTGIHTTGSTTSFGTTSKQVTYKGTLKINDDDDVPLIDMFVSPNKALCERLNSHRCVCSPCGMINFFSNELQRGNDAKIILKKLITYSCEVYMPIAQEYQIAADMKPRLISKKKRELVESDFGPKEITPFAFDELMMRGIPKEGVDFFVFPSTTVEIPCFTSDEMKLSPNIADSALYRWSHSNLKAITEGRILEDANHKGSLIIQDVTLGDSDNYTCKVKYIDPDSQITVKRTFIHAVRVVVLPRLALHTNLHYSASSLCDQELLEMFELYLPQQIESSICSLGKSTGRSLCTIEIHNPVCYTKNKQDSRKRSIDPRLLWRTDFQKSRWIRDILNEEIQEMEISLNYELDLTRVPQYVPDAMNWSLCSPHCQQKLSLKTIEILRDSFLDALLLPVKTKSVYFQPSLDSINIKMLTACDGGLELKDGFCVPCKRHHYSEQGKTVCLPCPSGTFQDNIGAKSCIPCPHPFRPNCFYLGSMKNFTMFAFAILIGWALLGTCWLFGSQIRIKALGMKKVKRKKPEPLPPDFE